MFNDNFDAAFEKIRYQLAPLETERQNVLSTRKHTFFIISIVLAMLGIAIFAFFLYKNPIIIVSAVIITAIACVVVGSRLYKAQQAFEEKVKGGIIPEIVKVVRPDLKYEPWDSIEGEEFYEADFFNDRTDKFSGEDYLEGYINNTHFKLSEVALQKVTKDKNGKKKNVTFFKGLLIIIPMPNMPKNAYARIERKGFGNAIAEFFGKLFSGDLKAFETDNTAFNENYKLLSDNKEMVHYIFTEQLLNAIFTINKQISANKKLDEVEQIAFTKGNGYFLIKHNEDLFSPDIKSNLQEKETCKQFYNDLMYVLNLVDTITK